MCGTRATRTRAGRTCQDECSAWQPRWSFEHLWEGELALRGRD